MPGFLTVPWTVYPFSSSSLTSHEAMYPAAPVTHTVCPFPGCTGAAVADPGFETRVVKKKFMHNMTKFKEKNSKMTID
jgi:hypothetical protein